MTNTIPGDIKIFVEADDTANAPHLSAQNQTEQCNVCVDFMVLFVVILLVVLIFVLGISVGFLFFALIPCLSKKYRRRTLRLLRCCYRTCPFYCIQMNTEEMKLSEVIKEYEQDLVSPKVISKYQINYYAFP